MRSLLGRKLVVGVLTFLFVFAPMVSHAFTISPPFHDNSLNPGDTALDVVKLYNEDDDPLTLYPFAMNFTSGEEEEGIPQFYSASEDRDGTGLAPWMDIQTEPITIMPHQLYNFAVSINVPQNAQPGGHYGAVIFSTQPPELKGAIGVGAQIAALFLVKVSGEVDERGRLEEFSFAKPLRWYNYLPVDFFLRFENSGNTHLRPVGNLVIKNMVGQQVASIPVNKDSRSVLPKSIRKFSFGWSKNPVAEGESELRKEWNNFAVGRYTAELIVNYGSDNKVIMESRQFWVLPWRILSIAGGSLIVLLVVLYLIIRGYNRWIIARYRKMMEDEMAKREAMKAAEPVAVASAAKPKRVSKKKKIVEEEIEEESDENESEGEPDDKEE